LLLANFNQSPAEKYFYTEMIPYKWCLAFFVSLLLGLDDKIEKSLYICMLSALIISPFNFLANCIANFDFPDAVGPAKRIIFLDKLI